MTPQGRGTLFGRGELHAAMSDLATGAEKVKASERLAGHSNTGAVTGFNKTNVGLWSAVGALLTGHPIVAAGLAAPAAYQRISAQVLTSPRLLRWLTRVPPKATYEGQAQYLSRLTKIAISEPAIANDALGLQTYLRAAMRQSPGRAAAADQVQDGRHVPPDQRRQQDERR